MSEAKIAVVMGSDSDLPVAEKCFETLRALGLSWEARVLSAHRSPDAAWAFTTSAAQKGFAVIIAIAGGAAALPGYIASGTDLPVIAVPVATKLAGGLDSLLSCVQMPGGVPVLSVGTNSGGPVNAAVAAARILALSDEKLAARLAKYRGTMAEKVAGKDRRVQSEHGGG